MSGDGIRRVWAVLLLVLLTVGAHAWDLSGDFVYDDYLYVVDNPEVQAGIGDWTRFFTNPDTYSKASPHHYRPLVALSYAANVSMGGGTFGFKATQLGLHLLGVLALYWLVGAVRRSLPGLPPGTAFAASLWVAVAPFNVDAVHYITARSSILCGLFCVVSVACFVRMRQSRGVDAGAWYAGHLLALLLAALSKETALALPAVLLAADLLLRLRAPASRRALRYWWPYLPYAVGALVAWVMLPNVHRVSWHLAQVFGEEWRRAAAVRCLVENVRLMVLPTDLSIAHPIGPGLRLADPATIGAGLVVAGLVAGAWWARRAAPLVAFGLAWYFLLIFPSTFVHLNEVLQEHRGYPASMGVGMALGWAAAWTWMAVRRRRALVAVGLASAFLLLLSVTNVRQRVWENELTLWTQALTVHPTSARAYGRIALYYKSKNQPGLAERALLKALTLDPLWTDVAVQLAWLYRENDRLVEAERLFRLAHQIAPRAKPAFGDLVRFYEETGQLEKTVPLYQEALRLWPDHTDQTHLALSGVHRRLGDLSAAEGHVRQALALRPGWAQAVAELGLLARAREDPDEAVERFRQAAELAPRVLGYQVELGRELVVAGRADEAVGVLAAVVGRAPEWPDSHFELARALEAAGQGPDAAAHYRRFLALAPESETGDRVALARDRLATLAAPTGAER